MTIDQVKAVETAAFESMWDSKSPTQLNYKSTIADIPVNIQYVFINGVLQEAQYIKKYGDYYALNTLLEVFSKKIQFSRWKDVSSSDTITYQHWYDVDPNNELSTDAMMATAAYDDVAYFFQIYRLPDKNNKGKFAPQMGRYNIYITLRDPNFAGDQRDK